MFRKLMSVPLLVVLVAAVPATAQAERKEFQVFNDVSRAVLSFPNFTIFDDVSADVSGGTVVLLGRVTMPYKRTDIEKRVARIEGVQSVVNKITVLPVSHFDEELRYVIARAIYGNSSFWHYAAMPNPPIHIVVENGHVRLTGVVNSPVERVLARSLASSSGAFSVKCELKTDAEMRDVLEKMKSE